MPDSPVRWSLVGVGRAGIARARAILADPNSRLVCTWRGRNAERLPAIPQALTLAEAIDEADAVAICSPDAAHPHQVREALEAGRHVVCEYPVAADPYTARDLFDLAKEKQRVLHVEHIELLSPPQVMLRAHVRTDPIRSLRQVFTRPGDETASATEIARRNLARIHRIIDLCGSVKELREVVHEPGLIRGELAHSRGAVSQFEWSQSPYDSRATRMEATTSAGETWSLSADTLKRDGMPQTLIEADPLFDQDHRRAMARIQKGAAPYVDEARLVHALQVLSRIADGRQGRLGSR